MKKTIVISFEIEEFKNILNDIISSTIRESKLNFNKEGKGPKLLNRKEVLKIFKISSVTLRVWMK
jgi:hypothetical protein